MFRFLLGLGIGYAVGVLIAPRPGAETRQQLMETGQEKAAEVVEMGRERAGEMAREAAQKAYDQAALKTVGQDIVDRSRRA